MQRHMILIAVSLFVFSSNATAANAVEWSYTGTGASTNWGDLDPAFATCAAGKNQSPIDVSGTIDASLAPIDFQYGSFATELLNNGHTVQLNFASMDGITIEGRSLQLKQLHFHAPSENRIHGESFAAEIHLVHVSSDGDLAVVGVMVREGAQYDALSDLWKRLPEVTGTIDLMPEFGASMFLPDILAYYRFNGSLTTPPCSEGVLWMVLKTPLTISKQQIDTLKRALGQANNREVQPVNARPILE